MRKSLVFLSLLASCFGSFAQNATISGSVPALAGGKIIIANIGHFTTEALVNETGFFKASLQIEPGFYPTSALTTVYMEPGMNLQLSKVGKDVFFSGKGSDENNLIVKLNDIEAKYLPVANGQLTDGANFMEPDDFLTKLNKYKEAANKLLADAKVSPALIGIEKEAIEYECSYLKDRYKYQYGIDPVKRDAATKAMTDYARNRKPGEPMSVEVLRSFSSAALASQTKRLLPADRDKFEVFENFDVNNERMYTASALYRKMLDARLQQMLTAESTLTPSLRKMNQYEGKMYIANKAISNSFIKEHLLHYNANMLLVTGKGEKEKYYQAYMSAAKDPIYIADIESTYSGIKLMSTGSASPTFNFPDVNARETSLSSFKGNYVYIDLWATWCGPCIAEIPSLKELTKLYEGKNIKFVSISVDAKRDADKWKKYVTDNALSGTQLISVKEDNSEFIKFYKVATIPRFLLLDPDGKIVSADAKRPSNPALRNELDALLK